MTGNGLLGMSEVEFDCGAMELAGRSTCNRTNVLGIRLSAVGLLLVGADQCGEWVRVGVHGLLEQAVEEQAPAA